MSSKIALGLMLALVSVIMVAVITTALAARLNLRGIPAGYLVQSGSMEPTIHVGDLALVKSSSDYQQDDIVTFYDTDHRVVTHRIASVTVGAPKPFITKGDANQTADSTPISQTQIIGKVIATVPKVGTIVSFAHSSTGLLVLIVIPAVLIVIDEIIKLFLHLSSNK